MFKHLFKLIWNKKKQNALLMFEIFISFMVLFAVFTLMVFYYNNYKKPMGLDYENVWAVGYNNQLQTDNGDSLKMFYETLRQSIKSIPQVKEISFSADNIPFSQSTSQNGFKHNGKNVNSVNWYFTEDSYATVLNAKILEGRWFSKQDVGAKDHPVVINGSLKERLFGKENAIGKLIGEPDRKLRVVGVVQDIKFKGDYTPSGIGVFNRIDTAEFRWLNRILIKVSSDANAAVEGHLYKIVANHMKEANIEIEHLTEKRKAVNYFALVPMIVLSIVAGFLIINVTLGLFGVLWYNINKRRGEIGLRRAVGASGSAVSGQLVTESMILATLALFIGSFFAIQFPLLNVFNLPAGVYITALLLSIAFIYLLVLVCSLYPGRQAAAVYPAVALHED
jgi:putative ABC transport system permease protein